METIKKEKKADLEQLLNSLVSKGWKPFGRKKTLHITIYDCDLNVYFDGGFMNEDKKSFRELVSKESGLWQFVCENRMLNKRRWSNRVRLETYCGGDYIEIWTGDDYDGKFDTGYEYRLIESSLKDESELEDFLLNSISLHE